MQNTINDTKPIIPPITALSLTVKSSRSLTFIKNSISITAAKQSRIQNAISPMYGVAVNIPNTTPRNALIKRVLTKICP